MSHRCADRDVQRAVFGIGLAAAAVIIIVDLGRSVVGTVTGGRQLGGKALTVDLTGEFRGARA
jgi:hypothetical protein